jgi:hypothetical protein
MSLNFPTSVGLRLSQFSGVDVRFWHKADMATDSVDVRFWGKSGHGDERLRLRE